MNAQNTREVRVAPDVRQIRRVTLPIYGLACGGGGALSVERALQKTPGVTRVYVNPAMEMAYVEYDACNCSPEFLVAAVGRTGLRAGVPVVRHQG
jgi:copper chaperone CopZ